MTLEVFTVERRNLSSSRTTIIDTYTEKYLAEQHKQHLEDGGGVDDQEVIDIVPRTAHDTIQIEEPEPTDYQYRAAVNTTEWDRTEWEPTWEDALETAQQLRKTHYKRTRIERTSKHDAESPVEHAQADWEVFDTPDPKRFHWVES